MNTTKTKVEFAREHQHEKNQVYIAISGDDPNKVKKQLEEILMTWNKHDRPIHQNSISCRCYVEVSRPKWEGY